MLEEQHCKLINLKTVNDSDLKDNENEKYTSQIADITDEDGLKKTYEAKDDLYQHYNKIVIAGTNDFPNDHIDDTRLPFDDALDKTKRGREADAYYRSHHEIDTVIGHSLGGAVALSLEKQYKKEGNNPYGIVQSKTFGAPMVSGNVNSPKSKGIIQNEIVGAGVAGGLAIGTSAGSDIGFADGGLLSGLGADIGKQLGSDMSKILTEDDNTSPDGIRYFGGPISALDVNSTTVMPSMDFRWNNSAHSYKGCFIKRCCACS